MLAKNIPVTIEADIKNTFYPNPPVFNVVGEIPGTDKADEIVMLGGHFDTWHAATGATDNGVRRRGDDGSDAHPQGDGRQAAPHRAHRPVGRRGAGPARLARVRGRALRRAASRSPRRRRAPPAAGPGRPPAGRGGFGGPQGPLEFKPDYDKFSVYFNIDNGTGALRGIYLQGNDAVGADLPRVDGAVPQPRHDDDDDPEHGRHRPPVLRRASACRASSSSRTRWSTTR